MVQLTRLLYWSPRRRRAARRRGGRRRVVSEQYGRARQRATNVQLLVEEKLRPLGVLALRRRHDAGAAPSATPLLALRHRRRSSPSAASTCVARGFTWLHLPIVHASVLVALAALDVWLFGVHGIAGGLRARDLQPGAAARVLALGRRRDRVPRDRPRERVPLRRRHGPA